MLTTAGAMLCTVRTTGVMRTSLLEAKEKMDEMRLPEVERQAYQFYKRFLRDRISEEYNKQIAMEERLEQLDAVKAMVAKGIEEGIAKGMEEGAAQERAKAESEKEQMIWGMADEGFSAQQIARHGNYQMLLINASDITVQYLK